MLGHYYNAWHCIFYQLFNVITASPIRFIGKQVQYGSAILVSSFFNGLLGNASLILIVLVALIMGIRIGDIEGIDDDYFYVIHWGYCLWN